MATMGPQDREGFARGDDDPSRVQKVVLGGSIAEAVCGAGTVVLAIIALAGAMPGFLASIATIVLGVALIAHGGAVAARLRELTQETSPYGWDARAELGGGMGAELIGGAAGVVLGILALLGVGAPVLIPIAVILAGGALLLGAPASGAQALAGVAGVVLGIVALAGVAPLGVVLVALLVLGAAVVLSGVASSGRVAVLTRR
jgi:hypothetical protein